MLPSIDFNKLSVIRSRFLMKHFPHLTSASQEECANHFAKVADDVFEHYASGAHGDREVPKDTLYRFIYEQGYSLEKFEKIALKVLVFGYKDKILDIENNSQNRSFYSFSFVGEFLDYINESKQQGDSPYHLCMCSTIVDNKVYDARIENLDFHIADKVVSFQEVLRDFYGIESSLVSDGDDMYHFESFIPDECPFELVHFTKVYKSHFREIHEITNKHIDRCIKKVNENISSSTFFFLEEQENFINDDFGFLSVILNDSVLNKMTIDDLHKHISDFLSFGASSTEEKDIITINTYIESMNKALSQELLDFGLNKLEENRHNPFWMKTTEKRRPLSFRMR